MSEALKPKRGEKRREKRRKRMQQIKEKFRLRLLYKIL